jgi:N-acetylglucosamine repressor
MNITLPRIQKQAVPSLLNEINTLNVIRLMWFESPLSRAELSRKTGLSKPTISKIVQVLSEQGLLELTGENSESGNAGKKAQLYRFNPNAGYILVCDIQETYIEGAISDCIGNFLDRFRYEISAETSPDIAIKSIISGFDKLMRNCSIPYPCLLGVGISIPGVIDYENGMVINSPGLPRWNGVQIRGPLEDIFKTDVFVENENRLMAVAEHWFGAAMDVNDFISISMGEGTGTGSAIYIGGSLWRGANNVAGEIGHTRLNIRENLTDEQPIKLNSYLAVWSFLKHTREIVQTHPQSILGSFIAQGNELMVKHVFDYANLGDEAAMTAVADLGEWLGLMIGNILLTIDLPMVVINGPYRNGGQLLMDYILDSLHRMFQPMTLTKTNILYSGVPENIKQLGALSLVLQHHFTI